MQPDLSYKVLIIGASGFVGSHVLRQLPPGAEAVGTCSSGTVGDLVPLDVRDPARITQVFRSVKPRLVIMTAALADADHCERDTQGSHLVNVEGPRSVAHACEEAGARLVFFSTDYVFDGGSGPNAETDPVNPIISYGAQKAGAERAVLFASADALVIRTSLVYGPRPDDKGLITRLVRALRAGRTFAANPEQFNSPTCVADLVEGVWKLVEGEKRGIYHLAGPECMSRFQFAVTSAMAFGLDPRLVVPAAVDGVSRRPLRCGLTIEKAAREISYRPLSPRDGLHAMYGRLGP